MARKTTKANNKFLLGSIILMVLVLVVVVLFLFLSMNILDKKDGKSYTDRYEVVLDKSVWGIPMTIYLNDSLLFSGTPQSELRLTVGKFAQENSLLIVHDESDKVSIIGLSDHSETVRIISDTDHSFTRE